LGFTKLKGTPINSSDSLHQYPLECSSVTGPNRSPPRRTATVRKRPSSTRKPTYQGPRQPRSSTQPSRPGQPPRHETPHPRNRRKQHPTLALSGQHRRNLTSFRPVRYPRHPKRFVRSGIRPTHKEDSRQTRCQPDPRRFVPARLIRLNNLR